MRGTPRASRKTAEKLFNRKATPDANLSMSAFLSKKVAQPIRNYGNNVVGGAKIVGKAAKSKLVQGEELLKKAMRKFK